MKEFVKTGAFSRHVARELLQLLVMKGVDLNYNSGFNELTPLITAIKGNNKSLLQCLLNPMCAVMGLDPNKCANVITMSEMTPLHILVVMNDYNMMSKLLESKSQWKEPVELNLKDSRGRNPCDVAIEMGHQQMLDLL